MTRSNIVATRLEATRSEGSKLDVTIAKNIWIWSFSLIFITNGAKELLVYMPQDILQTHHSSIPFQNRTMGIHTI